MASEMIPEFRIHDAGERDSFSESFAPLYPSKDDLMRARESVLGERSGVDGYSHFDELPPVVADAAMSWDEALTRVAWLHGRERATGRRQNDRNAVALELAVTAMRNQQDREREMEGAK